MKTSSKELIVGLVFFGILVVIGAFTIVVSGVNPLKPPQELVVYFKDGVGGLREGNVVRISGLEVGQVEEMRLQDVGVLALLRVQSGVQLYPGYEIKVRAFSALGGKYVDIQRGNQSLEPLGLGAAEQRSFEDWNLSPTVALHRAGPAEGRPLEGHVEADLIGELGDMAEAIRPNVEKTIENLRVATDKIVEQQGTVGELLGNKSLYNSLDQAAKNFEVATGQLSEILVKVNSPDSGTFGRLINDPRLYEGAAETFENLGEVTGDMAEGRGSVGRLLHNETLVVNLERATASLANTLAALEATPDHPTGKGTAGRFIHDPKVYDELSQSLEEMRSLLVRINEGKSPLGIMTSSEAAGARVERIIANIEKTTGNLVTMTDTIVEGKSTVGRLVMDDRLVREAERVLVQLRESVEDVREQAPIQAFVQAVFQAF